MIIKAVTLFLVFMLVLGMFGKLRAPQMLKRKPKTLAAEKCDNCGAMTPKGSNCLCSKRKDT